MKKKNLISAILASLIISLITINNVQAKAPVAPVQKGTVTFSAGVGIGNEYKSNYYNSALGTKAVIEVGLWKAGPGVITLGGEVGSIFFEWR